MNRVQAELDEARAYTYTVIGLYIGLFALVAWLLVLPLGIATLVPGHDPGLGWWTLGIFLTALALTAGAVRAFRLAERVTS